MAPKGPTASLGIGCARARAVGVESICRELAFYEQEERRFGEEPGQPPQAAPNL
jgi:hypothetical protein